MKSTSGSVIDQIIATGIRQWFRERGFTRKGRSFFRADADLIRTANLQASWLNTPEDAHFAVNLGVEWSGWHEVWTGQPPRPNPAIAPTFIQSRLNPNANGGDYWWPASVGTNVTKIAGEVVTALSEQAEAFWHRYSDLDSVLGEFDAGAHVPTGTLPRLVHTALLVRAGRTEDAQRTLLEARRRAPRNASFKSIADRLGLFNPD